MSKIKTKMFNEITRAQQIQRKNEGATSIEIRMERAASEKRVEQYCDTKLLDIPEDRIDDYLELYGPKSSLKIESSRDRKVKRQNMSPASFVGLEESLYHFLGANKG